MSFNQEDIQKELSRRGALPANNFSREQMRDELVRRGALKSPTDSFGGEVAAAASRGGRDLLAGMAQLGHTAVNAPHNLAAAILGQKLASHIPKQADYDYSAALGIPEEQKNIADRLIQFSPEAMTALAVPEAELGAAGRAIESIPKVGKYLKTAAGNALSQGVLAAAQAPQNQGNAALTAGATAAPFSVLAKGVLSADPAIQKISKALLGTGAGILGYQGAKSMGAGDTSSEIAGALLGLGGYKGISPKRNAATDVLKGVEGTDYKGPLEASRRLGLPYFSPAEASGNPFTGAAQGGVGKTEEGAKLLYERGQQRAQGEQNAIDKLLTDIHTGAGENETKIGGKTKDELYEEAKPIIVPEKKLTSFRDNEIFKDAESHVLSDSAFREKLKGVNPNSIEYLDMIKRAMGDMIENAGKKTTRAALITNTQQKLMKTMDDIAPEYKDARSIAEREITRRNIEKAFNSKAMTGTNFGKFLSNKKTYDKLQNNLRNVPDAQSRLEDMRDVFTRLINVPTAKTAEALSRTSMSKERSSTQTAMKMLQEILSGGKYDKAAVNIVTSPDWEKELAKLKKITNTNKLIGHTYNLLGKAGGQALARQPMEIEINRYAGVQ